MEYLRNDFISELSAELSDNGKIVIANTSFYPEVILKELDPTAYEDAFVDWCNQKREERLVKADEILSLFDNQDRFHKLKEIYSRGAVTPFIGAGLSIPSGYPGWSLFLNKVLNETQVNEDDFEQLITNGNYEEAAELLHENLPEGSFLEQIENAFDISRDLDGCVRMLPSIFKSSIITTNFDNILERVYREELGAFDEVLLAGSAIDLPRFLAEGKRALVKLHGSARSSRDRVLTKSEYDKHYHEEGALERVIHAISRQTILFLGCSLTVDRTMSCLKKIVKQHGVENTPKHYAFLKTEYPDQRDKRLARRDKLAECNIHPIWYTDDHDECLEALLEKLGEV